MNKNPKKLLYAILFGGELFLILVAIIILAVKKQSFISIFDFKQISLIIFFLIIFFAFAIAISITFLVIKLSLLKDIKKIIYEIINSFNLNTFDIFIISLIAGICEEILFRGVLQPMLGIWMTSFIFILLHGYFNPINWRISVFGILMFCLSMVLGLIYIKYGLIAAIFFHIIYDFTSLFLFKKLSGVFDAA